MKTIAILVSSLFCLSAFAADYKCYSSKFPEGMNHAFQDGYTTLSVKGDTVTLEYFYVNTVAKETKREYQAVFKVRGLKGGTGKLSHLFAAPFVSSTTGAGIGEHIRVLYLEPALLKGQTLVKGSVGQFAFKGSGFNYDWNLCYSK